MKSDIEVVFTDHIKNNWQRYSPKTSMVDAVLINDETLPFLLSVFQSKDGDLYRQIHTLSNMNCMLIHRHGEYRILDAKDVSWLFYKVCEW